METTLNPSGAVDSFQTINERLRQNAPKVKMSEVKADGFLEYRNLMDSSEYFLELISPIIGIDNSSWEKQFIASSLAKQFASIKLSQLMSDEKPRSRKVEKMKAAFEFAKIESDSYLGRIRVPHYLREGLGLEVFRTLTQNFTVLMAEEAIKLGSISSLSEELSFALSEGDLSFLTYLTGLKDLLDSIRS